MAAYTDDEYKEATGGGGTFSWGAVPANDSSTGVDGTLAKDDDNIYICVSTDRWMKIEGAKGFTT